MIPGAGLPLTISIGLTQAASGEIAAPLLARADKALYNAKERGPKLLPRPPPRNRHQRRPRTA